MDIQQIFLSKNLRLPLVWKKKRNWCISDDVFERHKRYLWSSLACFIQIVRQENEANQFPGHEDPTLLIEHLGAKSTHQGQKFGTIALCSVYRRSGVEI